jgi:hypothetical protein
LVELRDTRERGSEQVQGLAGQPRGVFSLAQFQPEGDAAGRYGGAQHGVEQGSHEHRGNDRPRSGQLSGASWCTLRSVKKWLKIGALLLLIAWAPFIYAELTSSPAEKKERDLPSVAGEDDDLDIEPAAGEQAAGPAEPGEEAPDPEPDDPSHEAEPMAAAAERQAAPPARDPAEPVEPVDEVAGEEDGHEEEAPPPAATGPTQQLKYAFETEPRDALWASDTERRIAAIFRGDEIPEGMLERAACRRAVCRLDVRWTRDHATQYVGAYEALRDQFGGEVAVEPEGVVDEEGKQNVHVYVLRKGYTASDLVQ